MYNAGDFAKAAELYHTAFAIDPQPAFLFNAARSEQRLVLLDLAEEHFKQVLELEGLDASTRSRTAMHLQEIAAVRKALEVAQAKAAAPGTPEVGRPDSAAAAPAFAAPTLAAAVAPTVTVSAGAGGWKRTAGRASVGAGAALTGVGVWLLIGYVGDQATLDARREEVDGQGKVVGISYESYE